MSAPPESAQGRRALRVGAQVALGLGSDDFLDRGRIEREVPAVTGAYLDHPAVQALEQPAAVISLAAPVGRLAVAAIEPREEGVVQLVARCLAHEVLIAGGGGYYDRA